MTKPKPGRFKCRKCKSAFGSEMDKPFAMRKSVYVYWEAAPMHTRLSEGGRRWVKLISDCSNPDCRAKCGGLLDESRYKNYIYRPHLFMWGPPRW